MSGQPGMAKTLCYLKSDVFEIEKIIIFVK